MTDELEAALAAAGRAGLFSVFDPEDFEADTLAELEFDVVARAVLESLGLTVTGWEWGVVWDDTGESMAAPDEEEAARWVRYSNGQGRKVRRRTVESAWEDANE